MMARPKADKKTELLRLVEERALAKKQRLDLVPYFPKEIVSDILLRLPPETLQSLRFVCKAWHKITLTHDFIDTHLRQTEPVLIFQTSVGKESSQEKPNTFSVEAKLLQKGSLSIFPQPEVQPSSNFILKFLAVKDGKIDVGEFNVTCLGKIRATCNGLILLDDKMKKGGLIVMNPVTKELCGLPPGTIFPPHYESYGLAYCRSTREYKLVHLFQDEMRFVGCEILTLGTRSWKAIDGPSMGLFKRFCFHPVFALGALHWIPRIGHNNYVVSLAMDEEKFHKTPLPTSDRSNDTILEMGGLLSFLTREKRNQIDVWVLKELHGEDWTKRYSITSGWVKRMVPLYARFNGEIVFKDDKGFLYAYDLQLKVVKKIEMEKGFEPGYGLGLPHVNTIVSWRKVKNGEDVW